ncbi:adrift-like FTSJ family RNA methylase [Cryptosporidium ryanae]|uniref:adrift-like FTSJ family RNA methylase n=1 Tax=Cryptosporidium ryanae TaxID=515981 RepID=UPI00351A5111|nr:adrift-like FTSJ family RNA methylase [Cryptosporidium ryanae]
MVKPEFRVYSFPPCETIRFQIPLSKVSCESCVKKNNECTCTTIEENIGKHERYSISELDSLKSQLDSVRSELNNIDICVWQSFTNMNNIAQDVIYKLREIPVELPTTGWCKLYEILHYFRWHEFIIGDEYHSMHLCECPGGFISALNHYINLNVIIKRQRQGSSKLHWEWRATSLNPYYEFNDPNAVLTDDIIYRDTYRAWNMGVDDSGDITNTQNIDFIWEKTSKSTKNSWLADLVTADGSIGIQHNPNNQEILTSSIQYSEVVCALGLLRKHGSLILKCFNVFNHTSISLIALLCYCFRNLHIVKPMMSKGGNGEIYLVAIDFQGIRSVLLKNLLSHFHEKKNNFDQYSLFPREWLPDEFIDQCVTAATLFCRWQIENISHNLLKFKSSIIDKKFSKKAKICDFNEEDSISEDDVNQSVTKGNFEQEERSIECIITKREKRLFALEYIQNLGIVSISTSNFILPNRRIKKEYANSTCLSRKGGERIRTQGIYIDRKYAFQQYQKLQETRARLYHPSISYLKFKLEENQIDKSKFIFLVDDCSEVESKDINCDISNRIPLKNKSNLEFYTENLLPKEKFPKNIAVSWFSWSKNDVDFQRLIDRLKSQTYMFESEHFFKKVPYFSCERLQMSPYCNEELIRRYCESIAEIKSPIKNTIFGIDTCINNEINNNFRWTKISFDILKQLIQRENLLDLRGVGISDVKENSTFGNKRDVLIDDLSLFCQIPANNNILTVLEALRELKDSSFEYKNISISQYLGKINKFVEIYNGTTCIEYLEDHSKFPLSYIFSTNSGISNRGVVILNNTENYKNSFEVTSLKNNRSNINKFVDISDEFRSSTNYKQIINAITHGHNIKKNDFDLIYIDTYSHLIQTYSLGQLEIENYFYFITNIMIALNLIKLDGIIIISLKTALTRLTGGIIAVLSSVFDKIGLFRPFSSYSPYSSSFHLICSGYNDNTHIISRHFFQYLWDFSFMALKGKNSIIQCVPPTFFASDNFLHWLKNFNNETITYDIDILETVIEQQQNNEESNIKHKTYNETQNESSDNSWDSYKNRTNIQRVVLSFILLGYDIFCEKLNDKKQICDNEMFGEVLINEKGQTKIEKKENYETNYFEGDKSDTDFSRGGDRFHKSELYDDSSNKQNIDPFGDSNSKDTNIDVFMDIQNNESIDPFI